jgi:hypothetical protein
MAVEGIRDGYVKPSSKKIPKGVECKKCFGRRTDGCGMAEEWFGGSNYRSLMGGQRRIEKKDAVGGGKK